MIKRLIILIFIAWIISNKLFGAVGCMDNSWHLQKKYDTKSFHYVQCNCPCYQHKTLKTAGLCLQCQHYHMPRKWQVIGKDGNDIATLEQIHSTDPSQQDINPAVQKVVLNLIQRYKIRKNN